MSAKIGFIGFGHMAHAICSAFIENELIYPDQIFMFRRNPIKQKEDAEQWNIHSSNTKEIFEKCSLILFCTPPQNIQEAINEISSKDFTGKCFVTILAGTKINFFEKRLGSKAQIVRVMPNIPAFIGEGMSVISFNSSVTKENQEHVIQLFSSIGSVEIIDEKLMDASCGISGSGPAFVAKLIDAFYQEGLKQKMDSDLAFHLACQTFLGTAAYLLKMKELPDHFVKRCAIKGGTTEAGLACFEKTAIIHEIQEVIRVAIERSKEISDLKH